MYCCCCRWLKELWNARVAPAVTDGVLKGSSSPGDDVTRDVQQKVANTALYVLIQRALVSHCPLVGYGKSFCLLNLVIVGE